jgi:hypothetical protein
MIQSDDSHLLSNDVPTIPQFLWNDGMRNNINLMASVLQRSPLWIWDFVRILAAQEFTFLNARHSCIDLYSQLSPFLRELRKCLHKFFFRERIECVHAFIVIAHTMMADLSTLNPLSLFDTDSSFWVCNNSAMGHICNNKRLFTDELVPSIFEGGSATGIFTPTLMGTVTLRITDDEGAKHSFTLKNVNYLPNSPVNILSLRCLAELYPDDTGHLD